MELLPEQYRVVASRPGFESMELPSTSSRIGLGKGGEPA
jgi:hypothetical protein